MKAKEKSQKLKQPGSREVKQIEQPLDQVPQSGLKQQVWIASIIGASSIFLAVYLLRLDRIAGVFVDDAWYALLAKSLATGQGYQLINSPTPGILPVYPPGLPFLLSIVFRIFPQFPDNVLWLKSVSILAMAGAGWACYRHFTRDRDWPKPLSLLAALTVTMIPGLVFLATSSLMSECVFILFQMLSVVAIEAGGRKSGGRAQLGVLGGAALAAAAFLTRSIGIGLIAACVVYLLKERRWRSAALFAGAVMLFAGPWAIYSRFHAPNAEQRKEQGGMIVQDYAAQFWQRRAGDSTSGEARAHELPDRLWSNAMKIIGSNTAMVFAPSFFRSPKLSGEETLEKGGEPKTLSYFLSLLMILGFAVSVRRRIGLAELIVVFTLAITIAWPWETFRFVLPLAPFLLHYLFESLRVIQVVSRRKLRMDARPEPWKALMIAAGCILAVFLFDHAAYWSARKDLTAAEYLPWRVIHDENRAVLDWINERAQPEVVVASENPALVYLYTGRKSLAFTDPMGNWENWKRLNVRYIARLSAFPLAAPGMDEGRFNMPFNPKGPLNLRVVDLGATANRLPWNAFGSPGSIRIDTLK